MRLDTTWGYCPSDKNFKTCTTGFPVHWRQQLSSQAWIAVSAKTGLAHGLRVVVLVSVPLVEVPGTPIARVRFDFRKPVAAAGPA